MKLYDGGRTVSVNGGAASSGSTPAGAVTIYAEGATVEVIQGAAPDDARPEYRDKSRYLFQRVRAAYELERFPGGGDFHFEYWVKQGAPGLVAPSGHGWSGSGTPAGGPTKKHVCPETEWAWDRIGGDVLSLVKAGDYTALVRNPATPIPWHVTSSIGVVTGQKAFAISCTQLLQFIQSNDRWCALLFTRVTGALRNIATRFAGSPPAPPELDITYADGEQVTLPAWVVTAANSTYSQQTHPTPAQTLFVEFARPTKPVASASMRFAVVGGSSVATYGLWPLDPPRNTEPVETGIADAAPLDASLASDPSIIDVQQFPDSTPIAQLTAKYINKAVTTAMYGGEQYYDPSLFGDYSAPPDTTKLPHTCRNQWLFAGSGDAKMEVVSSSYSEHGFKPLAPGIGAMKITRLPRAGLVDGAQLPSGASDDGHNLGAHLLLPAKYWGIAHLFTRSYWYLAEPEFETMAMHVNCMVGTLQHWTQNGGKWGIMPYCASSYGTGFSGTSGGGSGYQLRLAWTAAGIINDEGPLCGGWSIGLHSFDFSSHQPPGYGWGGIDRFGRIGGRGGMLYSRRWVCLESETKLNDVRDASGAIIGPLPENQMLGGFLPNGEMRFWMDGVKVYERTGLVMRTLPMWYGGDWAHPVLTDPGYIAGRTRPTKDLGIREMLFNVYHGGISPNEVERILLYTALAYGTQRIGPMRLQ